MNWTDIAKRYPMPEDAHPERPWWRYVQAEGPVMLTMPPIVPYRWVRADGTIGPTFSHRAGEGSPGLECDDDLARIDREHPLPAPEPACGQVWMQYGNDAMVADVVRTAAGDPKTVVLGSLAPTIHNLDKGDLWPPPGAVLIAGPGAPWAPSEDAELARAMMDDAVRLVGKMLEGDALDTDAQRAIDALHSLALSRLVEGVTNDVKGRLLALVAGDRRDEVAAYRDTPDEWRQRVMTLAADETVRAVAARYNRPA